MMKVKIKLKSPKKTPRKSQRKKTTPKRYIRKETINYSLLDGVQVKTEPIDEDDDDPPATVTASGAEDENLPAEDSTCNGIKYEVDAVNTQDGSERDSSPKAADVACNSPVISSILSKPPVTSGGIPVGSKATPTNNFSVVRGLLSSPKSPTLNMNEGQTKSNYTNMRALLKNHLMSKQSCGNSKKKSPVTKSPKKSQTQTKQVEISPLSPESTPPLKESKTSGPEIKNAIESKIPVSITIKEEHGMSLLVASNVTKSLMDTVRMTQQTMKTATGQRKILPKASPPQAPIVIAPIPIEEEAGAKKTELIAKEEMQEPSKHQGKPVLVRKLLPPNKSYDENLYVSIEHKDLNDNVVSPTRTSPRKSPKKDPLQQELEILAKRKSPVKVPPTELKITMPPVQVGLQPPPTKKRKEGIACPDCDHVAPNKGDLKKHMRKHNPDKPYACPVEGCNFRTKHPGNIRHHMPRHQDDRPHLCDLCPLKFKTKSQLNTHLLVHSAVKPFRCEMCSYSCKRRWELKQHMLSHSDKKFFSCDYPDCDHQTKTFSDLVKHKHKHKDTRDFFCPICNNAYKDNRALRKHVRYSHGSEPPVECNICHKMFRNRINLRNHMRLHDGHYPFKCEICQMKFSTNHNKKAHMAVHSGDRPFKCPVCPYAGKTDLDVRAHIGVMHRHEKIYKCEKCNVGFSRERGLLQHFETEKHSSSISEMEKLSLPPQDAEIEAKPLVDEHGHILTEHMGVLIKAEPGTGADYCPQMDDSDSMDSEAATIEMLQNGQMVLRPVREDKTRQSQEECCKTTDEESGSELGLSVLEGSVMSLNNSAHDPCPEEDEDEEESAIFDRLSKRDSTAEGAANMPLPKGTIGTITLQTANQNCDDVVIKSEDLENNNNNVKSGENTDAMLSQEESAVKLEPQWQ